MSIYFSQIPVKNIKSINKHAALDLIRFSPGGITRVDLARQMNLTRAAVSAIVNDLLDCGVIQESTNRLSGTGRPPIVLEINPQRAYVAGVDMGATHLTMMIANSAAHILEEKEIPFDISQGPQVCLEQADALLRELLEKAQLRLNDILAIGVGVPGPIVAEAGMVLSPPIMPGWDRFPIRTALEERWGCGIALNNDAELGAVGEWAYGAGRSVRNLAYIKVGTGVGAGLLLDGRIYRGATGSAGEIGHITIDENGRLCNCGNRGCLETVAGGIGIAQIAREAVQSKKATQLAKIAPLEHLTAQDVATAARRGDLIAQQILAQAGTYLGIAIAGLVNLINPEMVVVGGGVAQIGDLLLEQIRLAVKRRSLPAAAQKVQITTALLGRRSIGIGAIVQALSSALHSIADGKDIRGRV
ncbi:MAG: ROK family protein [Anaerolineae bacterium]